MGYYDGKEPSFRVGVLGAIYEVFMDVSEHDDPFLKKCNGYCDKTLKRIVICDDENTNFGNWDEYKKYCLRHEIIHAFLFESGIDCNMTWDIPGQTHPEHMVEWIGMQFPKLLEAFRDAGAM